LKTVPLVFLILGFLVGLVSYIYLQVSSASIVPRVGSWEWILAIIIYALIFCGVLSLLSIVGAFLYNKLSRKLGPIEISYSEDE
ncbi:hypothetical protein ACFL5N_01245, partial [bacterium]